MLELQPLDLLGLGRARPRRAAGRPHRRGRARPRRRPRSGGARSPAPSRGARGGSRRPRARRAARGSATAPPPPGWRRRGDGGAARCARSGAARRHPRGSTPSAPAAAWWSFRNAWIRSRASGGSWGLSRAASSAEIMSSLRRRAIAVQRARSIERSSTGGRVTARTTAAESVGSASIRSQASTSRTSGRWKRAASPAKRNGTRRSSSAAATRARLAPARADDHADRLGPHLASRQQVLDLPRRRLRLGALTGAAPDI